MNKDSAPKGARKRHDSDFKRRVLEHWKASKRTAAQVAAEFGVSTFTLYAWRKAHQGPMGALMRLPRPPALLSWSANSPSPGSSATS